MMTHSHLTEQKKEKEVTVQLWVLQRGQFINPVWHRANKLKCCQNGPCVKSTIFNVKPQHNVSWKRP